MNNKSVSPNLVSAILIGFTILFLALFPLRIELNLPAVQAQETPVTAGAAVDVASADTSASIVTAPAVVEYTLRTVIGRTPPMAFEGVSGSIEGQLNPPLTANVGDTVRITLINSDPVQHDMVIPDLGFTTGIVLAAGETVTAEFTATAPGEFRYYCSSPGHQDIGMFGLLRISGAAPAGNQVAMGNMPGMISAVATPTIEPAIADAVSIVRNPADIPAPVGNREPTTMRIDMTAVEVNGILADGTTFHYFTFDGLVPGPMVRIRQGDTVELHLHNDPNSTMPHSIDLHAVTGPGGGAVYTQTLPNAETLFTFQALNPGLYVYHCATPSIPHHISSGMYGLILVEPPGGLPPVDREFYVMQGEIYTQFEVGTPGNQPFSTEHMRHEDADYVVFNGAVGALTTDENSLHANVGETVRIFFGDGGPNYTSSFHVIGEIFDRLYPEGALMNEPLTNVQTTLIPAGGAAMVEFQVEVPGRYILVDHSLSRLERGAAGYLIVDGEEQPAIFHSDAPESMAGH